MFEQLCLAAIVLGQVVAFSHGVSPGGDERVGGVPSPGPHEDPEPAPVLGLRGLEGESVGLWGGAGRRFCGVTKTLGGVKKSVGGLKKPFCHMTKNVGHAARIFCHMKKSAGGVKETGGGPASAFCHMKNAFGGVTPAVCGVAGGFGDVAGSVWRVSRRFCDVAGGVSGASGRLGGAAENIAGVAGRIPDVTEGVRGVSGSGAARRCRITERPGRCGGCTALPGFMSWKLSANDIGKCGWQSSKPRAGKSGPAGGG